MNPALLPLLAVPLAAALVAWRARDARRKENAAASTILAALVLVLLSVPLGLDDGLPSGSSLLDRVAPWRGAVELPLTVNPEQNDLPYQVEPRALFVRSELRAGRLPFWNPYAFGGYPIWSAAQSAPLAPPTWLFAALPVELGLFALPFLRLLAAGLGTFLLARCLGLRFAPAILAGALFAFCGRSVAFALYPLATAAALVPWVILGVERIARGARGAVLLAVAAALQWTSGHPETAALTALGSLAWLLLAAAFERRALLRFAVAHGAALLLAGAALVPFLFLLPQITRTAAATGEPLAWRELGGVLLRLFLPEAFGNPISGTTLGGLPYVATLLYVGVAALPLVAVALSRLRGEPLVRRLSLFGGIALVVALSPPGLHAVWGIVPGLRHAIAHYLLPLALLAIALLAGIGLQSLPLARSRVLGIATLVAATIAIVAAATLGTAWRSRGLVGANAARAALLVLAPLALLAARRLPERSGPIALALLCGLELAAAHRDEIPVSRRDELFRETPAITALKRAGEGRLLTSRWTLPPNVATVFAIPDLRGADAVTPARTAKALGPLLAGGSGDGEPDDAALDRWSVRFRLFGSGEATGDTRLRAHFTANEPGLYERTGALPTVRFEDPEAGARAIAVVRVPGRWSIDWASPAGGEIVVAEAFDRGWSATLDGHPVAIDGSDPLLLRIPVEPGSGVLELRYRPVGLVAGTIASVAGLALLLALAFAERRLLASPCLAGEATGTIRAVSDGSRNRSGSAR